MKIRNSILFGTAVLLSSLCFSTFAKNSPHTWHTVRSDDGTWHGTLQMIHQGGSFVDRNGTPITTFAINPNKSQDYGFIFDPSDNFDVAYTLTLIQDSQKTVSRFSSKACVYVVTASGPAKPDIRVSSFNGATCQWKVIHGVGEDFIVA